MGAQERKTKVLAGVWILAGLLVWTLATAGNLEPNAPPAATMKTLDEIYDAVIDEGTGVSQREGVCKYFDLPSYTTREVVLTVPPGQRFVLLKLFAKRDQVYHSWWLKVNDTDTLIDGNIGHESKDSAGGYIYSFICDFPDRCVVVNAGDELTIHQDNDSPGKYTIIGYFYDVP